MIWTYAQDRQYLKILCDIFNKGFECIGSITNNRKKSRYQFSLQFNSAGPKTHLLALCTIKKYMFNKDVSIKIYDNSIINTYIFSKEENLSPEEQKLLYYIAHTTWTIEKFYKISAGAPIIVYDKKNKPGLKISFIIGEKKEKINLVFFFYEDDTLRKIYFISNESNLTIRIE